MDESKFTYIRQADQVLSPCGRPRPPVGSVVYIYKGFQIQANVPTSSVQTFYKEITGDTTWCWRSVQTALSATPPAISAVLTDPDNRTLFNGMLDLVNVGGWGSGRYLVAPEIECPPGTKIQLELDDNFLLSGSSQPATVLCGGAYAYYLQDGRPSPCPEKQASLLPRVFGTTNQNLMAPCWMSGHGPRTPNGYEDEDFTYGNGVSNQATVTVGGQLSAKVSIQIDSTNEFELRRFLFDVRPTSGVTAGSILVRARLGTGYVITDDFVIGQTYLGSTYFLKSLHVPRGDQLLFDLSMVDGAGSGTVTIEIFAEGVKRWWHGYGRLA